VVAGLDRTTSPPLELKVNFLRPAKAGEMRGPDGEIVATATARVIRPR